MRDTIDMAREVNIVPYIVGPSNAEYLERLKAFEALVRADEREACAKVCDDAYAEYPEENQDYAFALAAQQLAAAIRARGNT
jgi:hypothetical protein